MPVMPEPVSDMPLNALLDELDVKARRYNLGERNQNHWVCHRRHPRHPFRSACLVHFFPQGSSSVGTMAGRTRNLSRSGLAVLVRRVFRSGEPIEVALTLPDRPPMYVAGITTFCRYAGRGYHEVGVSLRAAGDDPVFSKNPILALDRVEWLRVSQRAVSEYGRS